MHTDQPNIKNVKAFWDSNPLLHGELTSEPGTREFFEQFDEIKTQDIFAGDVSDWVFERMRGKKVLDVGCGPGYWSRRINEVGGLYTGVDISSTSVQLTKKSLELFGHKGTVLEANAEQLPFNDAEFDFVVSEGVIHHTPNTFQCAREIYRVLKPGGEAIFSVYYKNVLLSSSALFSLTKLLMKMSGYGLKGRGREKMVEASSPDEFVRMYDGAQNPIGKAYSRAEFMEMLEGFDLLDTDVYYLPIRASRMGIPKLALKALMPIAGTMIMCHVRKR